MLGFSDEQLEVMSTQGGLRGAKARAELNRRITLQSVEMPSKKVEEVVDTVEAEVVESAPQVEEKPKRTTRKRKTVKKEG